MTTSTITPPARYPIAWPSLIWIGILHVGALFALVPSLFSWQALAVCLFMHWFTGGIGICLTYHRLLTHRSFQPRPKFFEYMLVAIGCGASEGGPIGWVADHRRHHAHSDEELDVHTPHEGFLWSHMMWFLTPDPDTEHTPEYYQRWAPDLNKDPVLRWFDSYHIIFPLLNAATLFTVGYLSGLGGLSFLVWGFFLSSILVQHSTWLVNSATHLWGYRSHKTRDDSKNNWWVALLTYGEGWHNNHHAYQVSARHGLRWWEFDMTYMTIKLLSKLGLAMSIKLPRIDKTSDTTTPTLVSTLAKPRAAKAKARPSDEEQELVGAAID